jgi:hypothetical protein
MLPVGECTENQVTRRKKSEVQQGHSRKFNMLIEATAKNRATLGKFVALD